MQFTATDGSVFSNRAEYRRYEMETQYTFRDKDSLALEKLPGSVSGQPFNIVKCNNCTITVLDHCDQVQIDNVTKSKIFIGASSESIFIRDCKDCTFTIACKQLRTRDCSNCTIYLYCKTEPIIESSTSMQFAPFNGAYSGHEEVMRNASLIPNQNLWHAVYDFNDDLKTGQNWSYVREEDEDELWCPLGRAQNCCPRIRKTDSTVAETKKKGIHPAVCDTPKRITGERRNTNSFKANFYSGNKMEEELSNEDGKVSFSRAGEILSTCKSFMGLLTSYIHVPSNIKNLFQNSFHYVTSRVVSLRNSVVSLLYQKEDTSERKKK